MVRFSVEFCKIDSPLSIKTEKTGSKLFTNMEITASFTIRNSTNQRRDLGVMVIAGRDSNSNNYDFGSQRVILEPWQSYTYRASTRLDKEGDYKFWISNYLMVVGGVTITQNLQREMFVK